MTRSSTRYAILTGRLRMALAVRGVLVLGIFALGFLALGLPPMAEAAPPQLTLPGLTVKDAERCVDIDATVCLDIPPKGDPITVSLVFPDADGQPAEHPVSEFVASAAPAAGDDEARFPKPFVFAGSHLRDNGDGPRTYLADESGNVISIATFGDELLCMDGMHGHANDAILWQINPENLPPVGAKVTLRLRLQEPSP